MQFVFRSARSLARQMREARAVLFDHSGTLVRDNPRDGAVRTPIEPMPGAVEAVERIRAARMPVGVVGLGGRAPAGADRAEVRAGTEAVFGRFDAWRCCAHLPAEPYLCRHQAPQLLLDAARDLDVAPHEVVVMGDVGPDVRAAQACGAVGILIPSPHTLRLEISQAPLVASWLAEAVDWVLDGVPHAMAVAR
jgi:D-glycero-D-manno-heptose 1,7-bisphosphate phosphatase